jgi:hypothetical protein
MGKQSWSTPTNKKQLLATELFLGRIFDCVMVVSKGNIAPATRKIGKWAV